jgi:hypothetical protein
MKNNKGYVWAVYKEMGTPGVIQEIILFTTRQHARDYKERMKETWSNTIYTYRVRKEYLFIY